jgi:quinol monooxygenase YgiN
MNLKKINPKDRMDDGCTGYKLFTGISVPDPFHVPEEGEREKHKEGHLAQPHRKDKKTLPGNLTPPLKIYEILSSQSITKDD